MRAEFLCEFSTTCIFSTKLRSCESTNWIKTKFCNSLFEKVVQTSRDIIINIVNVMYWHVATFNVHYILLKFVWSTTSISCQGKLKELCHEIYQNSDLKVMLQETILAQRSVASLLRHCFEWLQHCSNIATLCCATNRGCESFRVTSPLGTATKLSETWK